MLDEPGAVGPAALWFQRLSNSRIRLLCTWNGGVRGGLVTFVTMALVYPSQVLTGLRPFHRLHGYTPVPAVLRGERPEKPLDAESLGFSHALWGLVQLCWSESSSTRPTARLLLDQLASASLTWVPAPEYPASWADASGTTDSDSSDSLVASLESWTGEA